MTTTMNDRAIIKEAIVIGFGLAWIVTALIWLFS